MGGGILVYEWDCIFDYHVETHHGASLHGREKAECWGINVSKHTSVFGFFW